MTAHARERRRLAPVGVIAGAVAVLMACGPARPWQPPPGVVLLPGPPLQGTPTDPEAGPSPGRAARYRPQASAAVDVGEPPLTIADFDEPAGVEATERLPRVQLRLEAPYKLDERPVPATEPLRRADLLERRRWNDGGLGILAAEQPGPEGHPDPRVRVNVDAATGGLDAKRVQRIARQYHWINVVRCYRLGAYQDSTLRGWTRGNITINARGKVVATRLRETDLTHREVATCLIDSLRKVAFAPSARSTQVKVSIKVSPGDDPMPPPDDVIEPGEGELDPKQMLEGVRAGLAAFEACYRAGLEYAPELWGRIPLRFHLTEAGQLDEAFDAGGRFPDGRVKQCILREARKLRFPKPQGGDLRFVVPLRLWTDRADLPTPLVPQP